MIRQFFAAAVICITSAAVPAAASKKSNAKALAVLKRAIAISNIEAKGSPAFRLQAEVHIFNGVGQTGGMVMEFWASDKRHRKEVMVTGYNSLTVQNGKKAWTKSRIKYDPYPIQVIWETLDFARGLRSTFNYAAYEPGSRLKLRLRELEGSSEGKTKKGKKTFARCIETGRQNQSKQYCFNYETGRLIEERNGFIGLHYFFSDYQAFGSKTFPRTIRVFYANGTEMLEVDVMEIDRLPKPNPKLFAAVAGAREERVGGCPNMPPSKQVRLARLVKKVQPAYPKKAKEKYVGGIVVIHATIARDGTVHALWPLRSPSPLLTSAALAALRQWKYRPALFCGKPVRTTRVIRVIFNLGGM